MTLSDLMRVSLHEHAKRLWGRAAKATDRPFDGLRSTHRYPMYEQAYWEMRSMVEAARRENLVLRPALQVVAHALGEDWQTDKSMMIAGRAAQAIGRLREAEAENAALRVAVEKFRKELGAL